MGWYIKAMVENNNNELYNPCGSDYGIIIHDLKTYRGVINRISKYKWRNNVKRIDIYRLVGSKEEYKGSLTTFDTYSF